jgi:hypothetical protein
MLCQAASGLGLHPSPPRRRLIVSGVPRRPLPEPHRPVPRSTSAPPSALMVTTSGDLSSPPSVATSPRPAPAPTARVKRQAARRTARHATSATSPLPW